LEAASGLLTGVLVVRGHRWHLFLFCSVVRLAFSAGFVPIAELNCPSFKSIDSAESHLSDALTRNL
jgi:hypothetical protein